MAQESCAREAHEPHVWGKRKKNVFLASLPCLALCFQLRSRPFVWLLARTWIRKNTVLQSNNWCVIWNTVWCQGPRRGRPLPPLLPPPQLFEKKKKKRNTHFKIKGIFDGIRIFDWQTSPKHPNWWLVRFDPTSYGDPHWKRLSLQNSGAPSDYIL